MESNIYLSVVPSEDNNKDESNDLDSRGYIHQQTGSDKTYIALCSPPSTKHHFAEIEEGTYQLHLTHLTLNLVGQQD